MISASNISKSFGDHTVLSDVSFSLQRGEIVGLLGRNGAGKSTLLKILAGINVADQGSIDRAHLRIAFMSERNPLYTHMYIREYLDWVARLSGVGDAHDKVDQVISDAGLGEVSDKKIHQLSKGYKQRLGLAAALIPDPDVLILDEPINGLDPIQINEYRGLIKRISSSKVVILSSHLMQEIEALCDRVFLLRDGELSEIAIEQKSQIRLRLDSTEGIIEILQDLTIVDGIHLSDGTLLIDMEDTDANRITVFDAIVTHGVKILEMSTISHRLESVMS